ncbi:DUF2231 domain-containing protein [Dactylosporangium cerinum]|uniref:DUF2231 domain-containing protein n=1 Tax=Dactylosporangium cerinum TaxID=1434730 RepID=A0ABV9WFU6_9ACTN
MLDTINGVPVHPLVVHAVVVLLPLAALGVVATAVRSAWLARFGSVVVATAALAVVTIPLATASGDRLEARVGNPGLHAELGDTLLWFALPLLAVAVVLVWRRRRSAAADPASPRAGRPVVTATVSILAVVLAVADLVQVYRVGDSGARAAWSNVGSATRATRH